MFPNNCESALFLPNNSVIQNQVDNNFHTVENKINFLKPQFHVPQHIPRKLKCWCKKIATKIVHVTNVLQLVHKHNTNGTQNSANKVFMAYRIILPNVVDNEYNVVDQMPYTWTTSNSRDVTVTEIGRKWFKMTLLWAISRCRKK